MSQGMFMDGLYYACVSNNLAHGIGSFWDLSFTKTSLYHFREHPPLAFGIQSVFYFVFGDSYYIEKIYSVATYAITAFLICKIWNQLRLKYAWFALLLWLINPLVLWASVNNLLENTVAVFVMLSVLFYLKSLTSKKNFFIFLSGFMLFLGFLTKGFTALFPLAFPFIYQLIYNKKSFFASLKESILVLPSCIIPLLLLLLFPEARESISQYMQAQVVTSLQKIKTVNTRFYIVGSLLVDLLIALLSTGLLLLVFWIKKRKTVSFKKIDKGAWVFFCVGLCGVLPIMVSMKQRSFYVLPAMPFFAMGLAIVSGDALTALWNDTMQQKKKHVFLKIVSCSVFSLSLVSVFYFSNKIGREKEMIQDALLITQQIPKGAVISLAPAMWDDWVLHAFYYRTQRVSLDADTAQHRTYYLTPKDIPINRHLRHQYEKVNISTQTFFLYKKKKK